MKDLVQAIVEALVDDPGAVSINEVVGAQAHILELHVAQEDVGKVIGRGGAHATAIRTLLAACGGKQRRRYLLEIVEHQRSRDGLAPVTRLPQRVQRGGGRDRP